MKPLSKLSRIVALGALLLPAGGGLLLALAAFDRRPILFQSRESRTKMDGPVYNRIAWLPGWNREVWVMQQSHEGLTPPFHDWDRLAIVIDKSVRPRRARFYQIESGALEWDPGARMRPLRATCFMCHSNGPRAVRPDGNSAQATLSGWDRLRVLLWNLRIKTYGRVLGSSPDAARFRLTGKPENEPLRVQTCVKCHNESWWARGTLTRQNFLAIHYMVGHGIMPPPGFRLSEPERAQLSAFVRGLP